MKGSDLDSLLEKMPSKYSVTMAVAQRAKQLEGGARCFLDHGEQTPLTAAIEEIRLGKVAVGYLEADEEEEEEVLPMAKPKPEESAEPTVEDDEAQPEAEEEKKETAAVEE